MIRITDRLWIKEGQNQRISQKKLFLHIFCNTKRHYLKLIGLYLGGIVVTYF
jgi:hypothetical protein